MKRGIRTNRHREQVAAAMGVIVGMLAMTLTVVLMVIAIEVTR